MERIIQIRMDIQRIEVICQIVDSVFEPLQDAHFEGTHLLRRTRRRKTREQKYKD
jgi:hypothetical protein